MIAVALVSIQGEFHAGAEVVWLISGLYLATAIAQPTMGRLADQFGPRLVFNAGLVLVTVAAVAAPFAPSFGVLLLARVVLGVGTSAAYPAGLALIKDWAERAEPSTETTGALGAISAASQVAVALGPPLGGVLVLVGGWRCIFWVNLPITVLALLLTLLWLRRDDPVGTSASKALRELDPLGILLFAGMMIFLLLFLLSVDRAPAWPHLTASVAFAAALLWWELRAARPFVDVRMLAANRPLTLTYLRCGVTYLVFYTVFYSLPQWLEQARSMTSAAAGLIMLPIAGFGVIATVLATRLVSHSGLRPVLVIGSAGLLVGSLSLLAVSALTPVALLLVVAAVLGLPNGFNSLGNQTAMYNSAPQDQLSTASGLYRTAQYIGANLASALVGLGLGEHATDGGLHLLAAVIAAISAGLLLAATTSKHLKTTKMKWWRAAPNAVPELPERKTHDWTPRSAKRQIDDSERQLRVRAGVQLRVRHQQPPAQLRERRRVGKRSVRRR
jgi:MFS family permease